MLWWHIKRAITPADYCDWLLNIGWLSWAALATKKKKTEAPVAHYGRQRWQVRWASGRSIAIPLCLCAFNWAFGAGIINMQLQRPLGARWRGAGVCVCVCVYLAWCVLVRVAHYSFVSPEWAAAIQSLLCAGRARETRGPSRHEITDYTLNASPKRARQSAVVQNWRRARGG